MSKSSAISRRAVVSGLAAIPAFSANAVAVQKNPADAVLIALGREFNTVSAAIDNAIGCKPQPTAFEQKIFH